MRERQIDKTDRRILYQLDIDCRRPNAQIAKKLHLSKQVVDYRIKRLLREGYIDRFASVIDTYKLGYSKYKMYVSLENADRKTVEKIKDFLKKHKKTEWIASCSGKWDFIAGYLVRDVYEFARALREFDERFSRYVSTRETTISLGVPHWRKDYLINPSERYPLIMQGGRKEDLSLDGIDKALVRLLVNNARMPTIEIAQRLGITPRIAAYRIKKLRERGVLLISRIFLNLSKLDYIYCKALIKFRNITSKKYNKLLAHLNTLNNLTYVINCVGSWDIELDFEIGDFNAFHGVMADMRDKFAGIIKSYDFVIVTREEKLDYYPGSLPVLAKR